MPCNCALMITTSVLVCQVQCNVCGNSTSPEATEAFQWVLDDAGIMLQLAQQAEPEQGEVILEHIKSQHCSILHEDHQLRDQALMMLLKIQMRGSFLDKRSAAANLTSIIHRRKRIYNLPHPKHAFLHVLLSSIFRQLSEHEQCPENAINVLLNAALENAKLALDILTVGCGKQHLDTIAVAKLLDSMQRAVRSREQVDAACALMMEYTPRIQDQ